MPLIEWNSSLVLGIDEIDQQHKQWIEIINNLDDALMNRSGSKTLVQLAREMVGYTSYHFAEEEQFMKAIGYPGLDQHIALHKDFTAQVKTLKDELESGQFVSETSVMSTMKRWLEDHIKTVDRLYVPYSKS